MPWSTGLPARPFSSPAHQAVFSRACLPEDGPGILAGGWPGAIALSEAPEGLTLGSAMAVTVKQKEGSLLLVGPSADLGMSAYRGLLWHPSPCSRGEQEKEELSH